MNKKQHYLSPEVELKIVNEYKAGRYNSDLLEEYNITKSELYRILNEHRVRKQHKRNSVISKPIKICNSCGAEIIIKDANYCPMCGNKVTTEKEQVIQIANNLLTYGDYIPVAYRKQYTTALYKIIQFVENVGNE